MVEEIMTFEDLESWRQARQMTRQIYTLTRNDALVRDFGLCSQTQRAGVSIMSNIAEGFERQHLQEKLQFYNVAHGSNGEVRSLTYVIEDNFPRSPDRRRLFVPHGGDSRPLPGIRSCAH